MINLASVFCVVGIMKKICKFIKKGLRSFNNLINSKKGSFFLILAFSFILNICLEAALRKSFIQAFRLIFTSPLNFAFNTLIVLALYSTMYIFKRRAFLFSLYTVFWCVIAIVSRCLMSYRTTPFNASDFRIIKSAITMIPAYLETWHLFVVPPAVILVICALVFIFIKCKKAQTSLKSSAIIAAIVCLFTSISTVLYLEVQFDTSHFSNLPTAYKKHGFNICFLCSIFDNGISKPKEYSKNAVQEMVDKIEETIKESEESKQKPVIDKPNIIFIQLESFYDVNQIEGYQFNQNPIPVFSNLKANLPHGLLTVPSIGAGTANTEFEVLTGMEVSFFGIAEYPYLSILQNKTCESMAYNVKPQGYSTHAIHNHKGTFYDRHKVFPNLGFDTFTSLENMPDIQKNRKGSWARDSMLTTEILRALNSTPENQDLIYTISVQPHGRYPGSWEAYEKIYDGVQPKIKLTGNDENPENPGIEYYLNELYESDLFIGSLISELSILGEPCVLVLYGDHLPAFTVQNWQVTKGDYYTTDYVIWNNCDIDFSDAPDLSSFQLCSYVFSKLGITEGSMNKLNQAFLGKDVDYSKAREILEYDLLYGDQAALNEKHFYDPTVIKYGLAPISIDSISSINGSTYIKGQNFNEYSTITIDGRICDTQFIDKNTLVLEDTPEANCEISVVQLAQNHTILGGAQNSIIFDESMILEDIISSSTLGEEEIKIEN